MHRNIIIKIIKLIKENQTGLFYLFICFSLNRAQTLKLLSSLVEEFLPDMSEEEKRYFCDLENKGEITSVFFLIVMYRVSDLSSVPAVRIYFQRKSLYTRESVWPLHNQINNKTLIFVPSGRNCSDLLQLGCCHLKHPIMHFFPLLNYTGRKRADRVGS